MKQETKMGKVGIIGAMEKEVVSLKNEMDDVLITKKASMDFYEGSLNGKLVVVVRSGVGKVNAAVCTQILIDNFEVDYIINTGIAGSLCNNIDIGDIVISTDVVHHDVNGNMFGYEVGQIPGMDTREFVADSKLIKIAKEASEEVNEKIGVFVGRIVSGDQFISDNEIKDKIITDFEGLCTEMEGAAIGQTAYLNNIPFVVIRTISDKADNSASVDIGTFEMEAYENNIRLVKQMLEAMYRIEE